MISYRIMYSLDGEEINVGFIKVSSDDIGKIIEVAVNYIKGEQKANATLELKAFSFLRLGEENESNLS